MKIDYITTGEITANLSPDERAAWIADYVGYYAVTTKGRVWSERSARFLRTPLSGRSDLPNHAAQNYRVVVLSVGTKRHKYVHRLVAETFLDGRQPGFEVLHGPAGRDDNSIYNLSWGTRAANMMDRHRDGTINDSGLRKLTVEQASEIIHKWYRAEGVRPSQATIAREYGVHPVTVCQIVNGKTHRLVAPDIHRPHHDREDAR